MSLSRISQTVTGVQRKGRNGTPSAYPLFPPLPAMNNTRRPPTGGTTHGPHTSGRRGIPSSSHVTVPNKVQVQPTVSIPDGSPSQLRTLATNCDDFLVSLAVKNGISPDLLRRYYVTQCTKTTVSRPVFFDSGSDKAETNVVPFDCPLPNVGESSSASMRGFNPPLQPTGRTEVKLSGYSCDIEGRAEEYSVITIL